jgi:hypothetical protein
MDPFVLDARDREDLAGRGITAAEIDRQLGVFRRPPARLRLDRPCTVGDGIRRIQPAEAARFELAHARAAAVGRFVSFVPASGAATRMFRELQSFRSAANAGRSLDEIRRRAAMGASDDAALVEFLDGLERFPFLDAIDAVLAARGETRARLLREGRFRPILDALLDEHGLDFDALPKGLLPFHRGPDGPRTPFEEHLVDAAETVRDAHGTCRLHFTVSPQHRTGFEALFGRVGPLHARAADVRYDVRFSTQRPSTDTIAVDLDDRPLRDAHGRLVFRPGGHGALIDNLNDLDAELVYVRNVDNVQPDHRKATALRWRRILGGTLVELRQRIDEMLERLRDERSPADVVDRAAAFASSRLSADLDGRHGTASSEDRRRFWVERLARPLRVCGVVPNTGEPGGGPFWVRHADGSTSLQIVESAQVDMDDPQQARVFAAATHFNPVDLVCSLRDGSGRPYDLTSFVDPDAVFVTRKSTGGVDVKAFERPGLWNGGMARWNTVFVEVPLETFSPVKTVLDLLRPEHQPV